MMLSLNNWCTEEDYTIADAVEYKTDTMKIHCTHMPARQSENKQTLCFLYHGQPSLNRHLIQRLNW